MKHLNEYNISYYNKLNRKFTKLILLFSQPTHTIISVPVSLEGILHTSKKTKSSDISTCLPPYDNLNMLMVVCQIPTRPARCCDHFLKFFGTRHHVYILFDLRFGS